jgi:hypothetical protein
MTQLSSMKDGRNERRTTVRREAMAARRSHFPFRYRKSKGAPTSVRIPPVINR